MRPTPPIWPATRPWADRAGMHQLSGLDAEFLAMESATVFGHVGSVCLLDPSTAPEPLTLARLTRLIAERLPLVPLFRRRLMPAPLGLDQPYWVDDPDVDLAHHVRELALPAPGGDVDLARQVGSLHARPLDRSRPLWEIYLITGLQGGRAAIYSKVHHAAIDGVSGDDILAAELDPSPHGRRTSRPGTWPPLAASPGRLGLLARTGWSLIKQPVRVVRLGTDLARRSPQLAVAAAERLPLSAPLLDHVRPDDAVLAHPGLRAPHTPFNASISPDRSWARADLSLTEVRRIKNDAGGSVNDVVMALVAGALRRWLLDHDALPPEPLVAAVPVSIRTHEQDGTFGNRVSVMLAALPTNVSAPVQRLAAATAAMHAAKREHASIPPTLLADAFGLALPAMANLAWRVAARLRVMERVNPFNLFVSNVPGPSLPLYYAGAQLLGYYPVSAIAHGQGLNITVASYRDRLCFGLLACPQLVPDLEVMAGYLAVELETLAASTATPG